MSEFILFSPKNNKSRRNVVTLHPQDKNNIEYGAENPFE